MAKKKEEMGVPAIVDSVETLEAKMKAMREAQKEFAKFSQEQVDKIFYEAAMAANKMRIPLAKMAVEETQRGVLEDKIIKNHYAAEYIYNAYKDTKTCGVIEEDTAYGIKKVAEPIGLVAFRRKMTSWHIWRTYAENIRTRRPLFMRTSRQGMTSTRP